MRTVQKGTFRARKFGKALRKDLTPAERKLWQQLRAGRLGGHKFRRQPPVGPYIADFACVKSRIIVEVDGDSHFNNAAEAKDKIRSDFIISENWQIFRCSNRDVYTNMSGTLDSLLAAFTRSPS